MLCVVAFAKDPFGPDPYGTPDDGKYQVIDYKLEDGRFYVTLEHTTLYYFPEGVQSSRRIWKDVYCASNGVIVLEKQILGNYIPPSNTPEKIEWPTNQ